MNDKTNLLSADMQVYLRNQRDEYMKGKPDLQLCRSAVTVLWRTTSRAGATEHTLVCRCRGIRASARLS